jgi:hypothetical protein
VEDYFRVRKYSVPIRNDSVADLTFFASVYMNQLQNDSYLKGEIFQKTIVETHIVTNTVQVPAKNKLFVGGMVSASFPVTSPRPSPHGSTNSSPTGEGEGPQMGLGLPAGIMFQTKRDNVYQAMYDPFNRVAYGGMFFKIHVRGKNHPK